MTTSTADLFDQHADRLQVADPVFRDYGGSPEFHGPIETVKVFEDNTLVRAALEEAGEGRVLVVDGGGSLRCALLGDQLARLGVDNGWSGIVVYGCIRDVAHIAALEIGVKALASIPAKSVKRGEGQRGIALRFAGVLFRCGEHLYADRDGIVVAPTALD